jgi:putative peptidoglycan lipid II flippase
MSLFRSIFTVSFFISLSRILGFIRDIFIAKYLGAGLSADAFFAAFRLPNFFRRVFAEGAFNSAFVPIFVGKLSQDDNKVKSIIFARNIFSFLFYALLIAVILMEIFMPQITYFLFPGFFSNTEKFNLAVNLSRITIFYLLFISLVSLCSGILNSLNKFAVPAASPIILNITLIFSFFLFANIAPNYAYALSYGVLIAGILQFLWVIIFTFRAKILLYPQIPTFNRDSKVFFKKLIPGIIGANVMQINLLVDNIIASLISGAVSYLYYADRINQLPLALIGIAIGIALLPTLSLKIKKGEFEQAIKLQNRALEAALILVIPASLGLMCLAKPIISTLFERGNFGPNQSLMVGAALRYYSLGLPAYVLVKVMEPSFFSRGNTKIPMRIAIICLINNLLLNFLFYKIFALGYLGIVLSSVISSYLNLILLFVILIKKNHFYFVKDFLIKLLKIIIPSIFMTLGLTTLNDYFQLYDDFHKIIELAIMIASGLLIYTVGLFFFGSLKVILNSKFLKRKNYEGL